MIAKNITPAGQSDEVPAGSVTAGRRVREAVRLRDNLRRRKEQIRAREEQKSADGQNAKATDR